MSQEGPGLADLYKGDLSDEEEGDEEQQSQNKLDRGRKEAEQDESRYMLDGAGNRHMRWKVEYAPRAGAGRAQCRDLDCLERADQNGERHIEKGALRIGRRVLMTHPREEMTVMYYHCRCMFNTFERSRTTTRIIEHEDDLEGFENITEEQQSMIRRIIDGDADLRTLKRKAFSSGDFALTPKKKAKAPRFTAEQVNLLKPGDRVWAHCRCKAPDLNGVPAAEVAVKSKKLELALIVEEPKDGQSLIVQFESATDEKERSTKFELKKFRRIRGWLKYPRIFTGKKQRIPVGWIDLKRVPPRLCSCTKQCWGHDCPEHAVTCSRGTTEKVWGVCQ